MIEPPFLILKNEDRRFLIRDASDNVIVVVYRTGPKGWITTAGITKWIRERRVIRPIFHQRKRFFVH